MKYLIIIFFTFFLNVNSYAVEKLSKQQLKDYENIPMMVVDELDIMGWEALGSETNTELVTETDPINSIYGACKGSDKSQTFAAQKTPQSFDIGVSCFVNGTGYHQHLRKFTDDLAQSHCENYNRNALYRGKGKKNDRMSEADFVFGFITLGVSSLISANQNMIVNSYVCEKNENLSVVNIKKKNDIYFQNSSRVDHLGILVEQKNNKLVITKVEPWSFLFKFKQENMFLNDTIVSVNNKRIQKEIDLFSEVYEVIEENNNNILLVIEDEVTKEEKYIDVPLNTEAVLSKEILKAINKNKLDSENREKIEVVKLRKEFCNELGFEYNTPEMGNCILRLMEIDAQQNLADSNQNTSNNQSTKQGTFNGWRALYGMGQALQNSGNTSGGSQVCNYQRKTQQAFNTICYYSCTGTIVTHNLNSGTALCPLTINR